MAHPHNEHRAHRVDHARVERLTKGYAHGGSVHHEDAAEDRAMIRKEVKYSTLKAEGHKPHHRADKPHRAKGGRVKPKATIVNVNIAPQAGLHAGLGSAAQPPASAAPPSMPPRPPIAPPGAPAGPMAGVSGIPPGVPPGRPPMLVPPPGMRARGGPVEADAGWARRTAKGGSLKPHASKSRRADLTSGPVESPDNAKRLPRLKAGPNEHPARGAMGPRGEGIGKGAPMTRRKMPFDSIEAPGANAAPGTKAAVMGPSFGAGRAGAAARLQATHRATKYYKRAV